LLGITTHQEALRALGGLLDRERAITFNGEGPQGAPLPGSLRIAEQPESAIVGVQMDGVRREIGIAELKELVTGSRAQRGSEAASQGGPLSDLLRAVGYALDELNAVAIALDITPNTLRTRFKISEPERGFVERELTYANDELASLRRAAAARRKGDPLRRILILHGARAATASVRELLLAEFAVEHLPSIYAASVAEAGEAPHLVLLHLAGDEPQALKAIEVLKRSNGTSTVPVIVIAAEGSAFDTSAAFEAGADDFVAEPVTPAILRARIRTWMLRRPSGTYPAASPAA
jgi:CheY-like chemotaxis protein